MQGISLGWVLPASIQRGSYGALVGVNSISLSTGSLGGIIGTGEILFCGEDEHSDPSETSQGLVRDLEIR